MRAVGESAPPPPATLSCVLEDVRDSRVSAAAARERYGVVLDAAGEAVDEDATAALRAEMDGAS